MRALIVKSSSLGDILHAFPVIPYLRCKGYTVDWVAERRCASLLTRHPEVERVVEIDSRSPSSYGNSLKLLRSRRYDLLFDLQGNSKSAVVTAVARARRKVGFGRQSVAEWPNLLATRVRYEPTPGGGVRGRYLSLVAAHFDDSSPTAPVDSPLLELEPQERARVDALRVKDNILLCPGSRWQTKMLPESTWKELVCQLREQPLLFCWGNEEERLLVERLSGNGSHGRVLECMPLPLLQHVMARCRLVVAVDSLPLHLAASAGTATLSMFGASSALEYAPIGNAHRSVQGKCPYGERFTRRCPHLRNCPTGACMQSFSGRQLADLIRRQVGIERELADY